MSKYIIGLVVTLSVLLSACSEDNDSTCTQLGAGCPESYPFACSTATVCYQSYDACASSGECP